MKFFQPIILIFLLFSILFYFKRMENKLNPFSGYKLSLAEWSSRVSETEENYILGVNHPPKKNLLHPDKDKALEMFQTLLSEVETLIRGDLEKKSSWFHRENDIQWEKEAPYFQPYALKKNLEEGSRVFFFGDLHGDIRSLTAYLLSLRDQGVLKDDFTLVDKSLSLAFLGDFTDKGNYGLEVLYTLLTLKKLNPDQVFLARGNHEDLRVFSEQGFLKELKKKLRNPEPLSEKIMDLFEVLPVVIYFGRGEYLQACHGGLEPEYSPRSFLTSQNQREKFHLISPVSLKKSHKIKKGWNHPQDRSFTGRFFGFMWSDFKFKKNDKGGFVKTGRYAFSQMQTYLTLKKDGVFSVVRAHQHRSPSRVMDKLFTHGLFRFWKKDSAETLELPLEEGAVFMLNMGVDSERWAKKGLKFGTFGELRVKDKLSTSKLIIHKVRVLPESQ